MPPRERSVKGRPKGGSSKQEDGNEKSEDPPSAREREAEAPPQERRRSRPRRKGPEWTPVFRKLGIGCVLFLIPLVLNYAALNQEHKAFLSQGGELYDIGWGQKLYMHCNGTGLPTVLLEAPLGQSSVVWSLVQPILSKYTKVCVYDRAGIGFSDREQNTASRAVDEVATERNRTAPWTVESMVEDLNHLVSQASNLPKPLLLVSCDFSTLISRFYAQLYDHDISGVFLIDPAVESLFDKTNPQSQGGDGVELKETPWREYWYRGAMPRMQSVHLSAMLGFNRLALMLGLMSPLEDKDLKLPESVVTRKKHLQCKSGHLYGAFNEHYFVNESMAQLKTLFLVKPFPPHVPVTVATYSRANTNLPPELAKVWTEGQKNMIHNIHTGCKHVVLPGDDYLIFYRNPEVVAKAVLTMIKTWRKDYRLAA